MSLLTRLLGLGGCFFLMAATPDEACMNTETALSGTRALTEKALAENDLNLVRYHTFKALNTLEKSRETLKACGCEYAQKNLSESLENLKLATRVTTLQGARIPLVRALDYLDSGLDALREHGTVHQHPDEEGRFRAGLGPRMDQGPVKRLREEEKALEAKINNALVNYEKSLQEIVAGVPCEEALDFVRRVYRHCEKQLKDGDLTAAQRYYSLRTREITEIALYQLEPCNP
jgi:hypothetical protein